MCDPAVVMSDAELTDGLVASMRAKIARELRLEDSTNDEDVTLLAVLPLALGSGDTNPLWTHSAYAFHSATRRAESIPFCAPSPDGLFETFRKACSNLSIGVVHASDDASYVNGPAPCVDGGLVP